VGGGRGRGRGRGRRGSHGSWWLHAAQEAMKETFGIAAGPAGP